MNIFAVDLNAFECARALDDKRLRKMTLETAQIICTALHWHKAQNPTLDLDKMFGGIPYKATHSNHPVVVWAREKDNFHWLIDYMAALSYEYVCRFGKSHGSYNALKKIITAHSYNGVSNAVTFVNCARNARAGIDCTNIKPVTLAYRIYLVKRWERDKITPTWTNRERPVWATNYSELPDCAIV